ncbi:hypothetical protein H2248_008092 [Termitomyces sp. 'cryptogamus']|nr:hypothetical protein H2248_008092 [Termitomyces sp. 'cryptogamus']
MPRLSHYISVTCSSPALGLQYPVTTSQKPYHAIIIRRPLVGYLVQLRFFFINPEINSTIPNDTRAWVVFERHRWVLSMYLSFQQRELCHSTIIITHVLLANFLTSGDTSTISRYDFDKIC